MKVSWQTMGNFFGRAATTPIGSGPRSLFSSPRTRWTKSGGRPSSAASTPVSVICSADVRRVHPTTKRPNSSTGPLSGEIDYDKSAPMNQTVAGPFLYGRTVCQGYACATQYLLRELGIESAIVVGQTKGGPHAWIIACLDGQYYHIDTTWGDPTFPDKEEQLDDNIDWWYLNLTTREISQDHAIVSAFAPLCTATEDNYFVKESLFLPFWSAEKADDLLVSAWKSGRQAVPVKFASIPDRNSAVRHYISEDGIRALFPDMGTFWYDTPDDRPLLSIIGLPPPPMPVTGHRPPVEEEDYPPTAASSSPEPYVPESEAPPPPQRFGAAVFRVNGEELDVLADGAFEIGLGQELEIAVRQSNTKISIDWGDDTSNRGATGYHVYEQPGEYTIIIRAKGKFGKTFRAKTFVVYVKGGGHGFFLFILFLLTAGALVAVNVRRKAAQATQQRTSL